MKISELKKDALAKLSGKWSLAIGINFVYLLITLFLSYIGSNVDGILSFIILLVGAIISIPFSYGLAASMLKLSRNESVSILDFITIGLQNFKRAILLSLSVFIRLLLPILLVSLSMTFFILAIIPNAFATNPTPLLLISILASLTGCIWFMYKSLSYALSTYLLIDNPEASSKEVIKKSCELMKGSKFKFIGLFLSFFGWYLLSGIIGFFAQSINVIAGFIVTYGTNLLLTPYVSFTEINFYENSAGIADVVTPIEGEVVDPKDNQNI